MSEVELIDKDFITRVDHVKIIPIDSKAYEQSQNGIERLIRRLRGKLSQAYKKETRERIGIKIEKLKAIHNHLQKALES